MCLEEVIEKETCRFGTLSKRIGLKLLAYLILPLYTLWFTAGYDWFQLNFSVIGYELGHRDAFLLWGILVGTYYWMSLRAVLRASKVLSGTIKKYRGTFSLALCCDLFLLFCAVTTPYLPNEFPFKAFLHIVFSALSAVLLLTIMLSLTAVLAFGKENQPKFCAFFVICLFIAFISGILLIAAGIVSSALEIFFTLSTIWLSDQMLRALEKKPKKFSS